MTIKAYRSTRYNRDRMPRQPRHQPKRSGSFWGVTWELEDIDDEGWDAMPSRRTNRR